MTYIFIIMLLTIVILTLLLVLLYIYYTMTLCYFRQKQALGVQNPCTQSKKTPFFAREAYLIKRQIPIATKNNFSKLII